MKNIKFRAWDKINEEMIPWGRLLNGYNLRNVFMGPEMSGLILMQYTGLKDKNGVEIFEGDIYRYEYLTGSGVEYRNSVVEWETTEVAYEGVFHGYELNNYEVEVIGNIYQNSELSDIEGFFKSLLKKNS